jgi:osmotically inducible protein OsmC
MAKVLYTAEAHVKGGRDDGHGRSMDGELEVDLRSPKQLGGPGGGTNPEELFAVGYAACFASSLQAVARRKNIELSNVTIDSKVNLFASAGRKYNVGVELDVTMPSVDEAGAAVDLVSAAHEVCPYSNATRGNIEVALTANGQPVGEASATA